ncbi:MAG: DUF423 domain-containing protein [Pirellulales bacterium]|nr:DUF423 domain-containing protein [Pirellulales bacterium]
MNGTTWMMLGAICGALGVSLGAFGAHGLESALTADAADAQAVELREKRLDNYEVATKYLMYHAPALIVVGMIASRRRSRALTVAGWGFLAGAVLFSGCLYAWVFTQIAPLVHIVPIGGTGYIIGWIALAVAAWQYGTMPPATSAA